MKSNPPNKAFYEEPSDVGSQSDSDSDSGSDNFFEESSHAHTNSHQQEPLKKKKNKHAPAVSSSKKPVGKIRQIQGLENTRGGSSSLYTDIRFDPAYGKADLQEIRKNYKFLDDYRDKEIQEMQTILNRDKKKNLLSNYEKEELQLKIQSLKSRVDTLRNRDLETSVLNDFKRKQRENVKSGSQSKEFFLKRSDKRKLIQKARFDRMKSSQIEKSMERKRKKRLGKEFRQLEFNSRK